MLPQIHKTAVSFVSCSKKIRRPLPNNKFEVVTNDIPIDQFFSQSHNLDNGFINTSPLMYDDPNSIGHMSPVEAEPPLPSDMSAEDIHSMCVSKYCQSPYEVSRLRGYRPNEDDYQEEEQPSVTPSVEPQTTE